MGSDRLRQLRRDDAGAVVVLVAAAMGAILVVVALVLDLGGARRDRESDQVAADAIALAAATGLGASASTSEPACTSAWDYLVVNLPTAVVAPPPACNAFATACVPTSAREIVATIDEYRVTLTNPVPDGHALLAGQDPGANDGRPCDRIGVRVEQSRDNLWTEGQVELDVDAVARFVRGVGDVQAPLVLLADHDCIVLEVGGSAGLRVETSNGKPGYIAIDSDGQECNNPNKVVLRVIGGGTVTADEIAMWALADGSFANAYSAGVFDPPPIASSAPVGREGMDWRYNCDPTDGCPGDGPAHIDDLVAEWGAYATTPVGFTRWSDVYGCSVSGNVVVPVGDWHINCTTLTIGAGATLTFAGGDIVSDGPIAVNGSGRLRVNCGTTTGACAADPASPSTFFLRSGDLVRNGDVEMRETFVYLADGTFATASNSTMTWTAPDDPAYPFDDLLLWTASDEQISLTGTPNLYLEGIFFAPNANVRLAGDVSATALRAQIFAHSADLAGNATLVLRPDEDRMLLVGKGKVLLIR